jgi:hypothetical protein
LLILEATLALAPNVWVNTPVVKPGSLPLETLARLKRHNVTA